MAIINPAELDLLEEAVVKINRTAKVTSRGKRFRFSALVVVGDGKGHIGVGLGKANEVISAISKGKDVAKRNIVKVSVINGTVPHKIIGKHGSSRVMLKPASQGTGIIAGAAIRSVMEQVGIHNILTKRHGSKNVNNMVYAALDALKNLKDAVAIANKRGITIGEVFR
ncbi:MAG: 30S ribosomal protein S5 [Candidatus Marinimicrobia bacterium]|nr:30S ribosomal protein S5 [Candidatus Neomarinimicrobiota bacterium]MBT3496678.1 30S ribosomal protein S5 [Candidatus Neomarinimicrobiota bacterium]MBT3692982.1 30S ribosomal protein S5 [Candidatus Neomarinimicrobiota bacterium]MBT3731949.1 30S ribosomal protein S5 [Candidatus Neomarinimicrobiota bacterium]MBT4144432.1 30S ribosomal protein S5 [Candidatus Neomarinimicrobiota bacterium]